MKFYSMKTTTILLCSVLSLALAKPNGVYHQEYNYKSSSSSYKNNELQHKNDDSGFYSKDGDFEGRMKPKVNAHNEHSEYVNPNLQTNSHTGVNFGENGEMNSYGRLNAQNYDQYGQNLLVEGLNGQSGYHGSSGYGGYGSSSSHSNYGAQSSYGSMSSSLQSLTARLQAQLEKQLQDAVYENQRSSSYSMQSSQSLQNLEDELRRNLTDNLDQEIRNQYGSQSIRGGYTYSIAGGKVQPTPNYRSQDLEEWRRQAESNLISKLHNSYRQSGSSSSSSSSNSNYYQHNNYVQTTPRGYSTLYPNIYTTTYRPYNYQTTTLRPVYSNSYSQHNEQSSQQIRYTPISNPATITTIAHNVQGDLNEKINEILEDVQRKYFTSTSFGLTNFDVVLERLENELRSNVTYLLDEQLRRNYGTQNLRDGYMYSVGPNGQYSSQYNYNQRDYDNLRDQVERNLLQKLKSDFESRKSRYQQTYQSSSNSYGSSYGSSSYGSNYGSYGQNHLNTEYTSMRPSATNMGSLITAGQRGIKGGNNDYRYIQGSNQRVYDVSGGVSDANLAQLQRQLQENLSRSLQQAISKSQYSSGYSSGSRSNNQQAFQYSLQQLSDELNRNLTRQLEEAKSGYGSAYSTYGSGVSESQLENLRSQLQSNLQKQLQQGLTQSWSSSSSYSASASSSNFRPVRGFGSNGDAYGQYVQTMEGEDCQHDDPNAYHSHRHRRHTG